MRGAHLPSKVGAVAVATGMALLLLLSSCGDDKTDAGACTPVVSVDAGGCQPLYEPTFDNVFAKTLQPTCAKSGVSCHASTGKQGGLAFESIDTAYELLTREDGPVVAGEPSCSRIVGRITATDGTVRMPPGRSLDPAEQCAVIQWIARGAKR